MRVLVARFVGGAALLLLSLVPIGCGGGSGGSSPTPEPPALPALSLTAVQPPTGDLGGGSLLNVRGGGFLAVTGPVFVHFGARLAVATVIDDALLRVLLPPGDEPASVDVRVVTSRGFALLPQGFLYLDAAPPPPVLTCLPPVGSWSAAHGGTRIDLHLEHFPPLSAPGVTIGGLLAPNLALLDESSVRVEVPQGLPPGQAAEVVLSDGPRVVSTFAFTKQGDLEPGRLSINEVLPEPGTVDANRDGTLSSAGDEFVELVNPGTVAIDLTGCTLSDATSVRHTFPNPTTVPAGGSIVIFGSGNPTYFAPRHASGHAQLAATGTLGLNNSAETLTLRDPSGNVVAQTTYTAGDVQPGRSRTANLDGLVLPVPATSAEYVFHDLAPGAVGTLSPGVKVSGAPFP